MLWELELAQLDPNLFVFIDESAVDNKTVRRSRGWSSHKFAISACGYGPEARTELASLGAGGRPFALPKLRASAPPRKRWPRSQPVSDAAATAGISEGTARLVAERCRWPAIAEKTATRTEERLLLLPLPQLLASGRTTFGTAAAWGTKSPLRASRPV